MNASRRLKMLFLPALAALALTALPADVMGEHFRSRGWKADGEIDDLKADVRYLGGLWQLRVRLEVEIEDANPSDRFDMVLTPTDRGRPLWDRFGRPIQFVVPLDYPTDIDDDELEFEKSVTFNLPADVIAHPSGMSVQAELIRAFDGRVLDRDSEKVDHKKLCIGPRERTYHEARLQFRRFDY